MSAAQRDFAPRHRIRSAVSVLWWLYQVGCDGRLRVHMFPMTQHVECVAILEPVTKGS